MVSAKPTAFNVLLSFILLAIIITTGCNHKMKKSFIVSKTIAHYPSASGIEMVNNEMYMIGDDANNLLIVDSNFNIIDSIPLYSFSDKRIPKAVKADLEAMTVLPDGNILLLGSGSLAPYRNTAWIINPKTKSKDSIRLDDFFNRLQSSEIKEINIEGIASVDNKIILANRGNKSNPNNYLIITENEFWKSQNDSAFHIASLTGTNGDTNFNGISGIAYSAMSNQLIMTASTEDTYTTHGDGAIGKSYLWIINDINTKLNNNILAIDKKIELDSAFAEIKGHKIESVTILKETEQEYHLALAADDDNGSSHLFKIIVKKD